MAIYSIRDLEKLTGVKAHTIRIWEQRYHLIEPARTDTNIRFYTDENLRHLFNIALLNRNGVKISRLAKMLPDEISAKVSEIAENTGSQNAQIDALTLAMIDLDEARFDRIFSQYVWDNGFDKAMIELIYPFLDKLNVLWLTEKVRPVHEKFISNLIRRKLMSAIDKEPMDALSDAATFLLYTPEGETQELTLLFLQYLLRNRQQKVVYLGPNISLNELRDAYHSLQPDYVYSIVQEPPMRLSIQAYVEAVSDAVSGSKLLLTGAQLFLNLIRFPSNVLLLNGLPDTLQFLDEMILKQRYSRFHTSSSIGEL